jgi:dienelactone hydrolase
METRTFPYPAGDIEAIGYLALPEAPGPRPGVLVAHEGPGLDEHARLRARMLAELGYVALAADLHGGGHVAGSHEEVLQLVEVLRDRRDLLRMRAGAAIAALRDVAAVDPQRIAAIGYCFGGMTVLELARSGAAIAGIVSFHGLLDTPVPTAAGSIAARILVCTGADDHLVPPPQVEMFKQEMKAAGADWQVITYGGARHAFTNRVEAGKLEAHGFGYHPAADRRSWAAMRSFLEEVL